MPHGPITRSRARKLQQALLLRVQAFVNSTRELKGRCARSWNYALQFGASYAFLSVFKASQSLLGQGQSQLHQDKSKSTHSIQKPSQTLTSLIMDGIAIILVGFPSS